MWAEFGVRVEENERENPNQFRRQLFDVIRDSGLRPGSVATKKMLAFEFGLGERLLWELSTPRNFFLHERWKPKVEQSGLTCELRAHRAELKDGGRHSALSRSWSFEDQNCIAVRVDSVDAFRRLSSIVGLANSELHLASEAVSRWIGRLKDHFPDFERFDEPDVDFDAQEREYKLEVARALRADLQQAGSPREIADAIHAALVKSNLLPWRAYWPMSPKGDADRDQLWPALASLSQAALGPANNHPAALEAFVDAWRNAVPNGSADPARQIAEFLFLHLAPDEGIYIRHSVRQDFWLEAVGSRFPAHTAMADVYRDELRFMQAVRRAFEREGLAPRDMVDVQGALWVAHSYRDGDEHIDDRPPLTRAAVEAAMDAFDEFRGSGSHAANFESFKDPRDYWVRSTRERVKRVYPTKAIVGFARGKTRLNGGWGQKSDAAALLHNSGFIIVDHADNPIAPPRHYDHLIREADRIRLCALNYHIKPARERRDSKVSISAGSLAREMGLLTSFPAICSALGGEKLQRLASLPPPAHTEPNPSSTTIFTFQLTSNEGPITMATEPTVKMPPATNLILYGPPGTGKTYATAWEAVRLCLGEGTAAPLREDRPALMAEYRRLCSDGRIEFVTFHQSFSYEEFVEGLRPTIESEASGEEEERTASSGGFNLKPHAGIFKAISERARLDTGNAPSKRLDRSRLIYKIALGQRGNQEERILEGLDNSLIHLGWGGDIDWSDSRFEDLQEIKKEWNEKKDPTASGKDPNIEMIYAFRSGLQVGDYVTVSDGRDSFRAFGRVTSDYKFDKDADFHPHRRTVEWIWRNDDGAKRASFYQNNFRRQSAYRLDPKLVDWDALEEIVLGPEAEKPVADARPYVLVIDEINRANISKVFGELITLLEPDKRLGCENEVKVRLPYSPGTFGVPSNLHVIGTMNTADRSIALLDTALRRRFTFRELMPDISALKIALAANQIDAGNLGGIDLCKMLTIINERIEYLFDREHQIGHAYFTGCRSRADVEDVMRHKIIPLLTEYFYEDWSKVAAVLGDLANSDHAHFVEAKRLSPPAGVTDDELSGEKLRWTVKAEFDFSEFAA